MAPPETQRAEGGRNTVKSGAKRQKTDGSGLFADTGTSASGPFNSEGADNGSVAVHPSCPQLPKEVWGKILEYLEYSEVRTTLLAGKLIACDAVDYVEELTFDRASELETHAVQRFRNLKEANLCCLLTDIHYDDADDFWPRFKLCAEAAERVVPFLQSLPKLEVAFVGGCHWNNTEKRWFAENYNIVNCDGPSDHEELYRAILISFRGAFKARALPRSLRLTGVTGDRHNLPSYQCTSSEEFEEDRCRMCREICSSFPLSSVILLNTRCNVLPEQEKDICISEENFCEIVRKRCWTEECMRAARKIWLCPYNDFIQLDVHTLDSEDSEAAELISRMKERKAVDPERIYYICSRRLKRIELLVEVGCCPNGITRELAMKTINPDHPSGGYILSKSTFDRLVGVGLDLDESVFVVADDTREGALVYFDFGDDQSLQGDDGDDDDHFNNDDDD